MEESNLDDFFAKKDKSRKKTKSAKFTTSDILAQSERDKADKPKKAKKKENKKGTNQSGSGSPPSPASKRKQEDEEWKDFVEEEQKDFSDLKIANLQIGSRDDDDDADKGSSASGTEDEDGEGRDKRDTTSGPWNKGAATPSTVSAESQARAMEEIPEPQPAPKEESKSTGKYIPPAARRAMESGSGPVSASGHRLRKKVAPNMMSEVDFPSLGGGMPVAGDGSQNHQIRERSPPVAQFEQVRGGGRAPDEARGQTGKVETGNMYDALSAADT